MIGDILPDILTECGLDVSVPEISAPDFQMRQMASLMNAAGRDINSRGEWSKSMAEFTVANAALAPLPADFQEMTSAGGVTLNGAGYTPVRAVISPEMWQMLSAAPSSQQYYFLESGSVKFSPAIGAAGAVVRYITTGWIVGGKGTVSSNDDVPVFPNELLRRAVVWRFKRQKGLPYDDLVSEFEADLFVALKADRGVA